MPTRETPRLLAITPVKPGREEEFEAFVRDAIVPPSESIAPTGLGSGTRFDPRMTCTARVVAATCSCSTATHHSTTGTSTPC